MENPPEPFEKLTTLLKLKRCELPPPGYFDRFSAQVIARIEALSERQPSWLKRFWLAFEARPSVAASCGVVLGTLLVTGFVLTKGEAGPSSSTASILLDPTRPDPLVLPVLQPNTNANALTPAVIFGNDGFQAQATVLKY